MLRSWWRTLLTRPLSRTERRAADPRRSRPRLELLEDRLVPATFTVMNTADSGAGSLRQAILDANATAGADLINFAILAPGVQTIAPLSALPAITDAVTIDGYTQPGALPNILAVGDTAVLLIELSGASAGVVTAGLTISAANCTVQGLVINQFNGAGLTITGAAATGNLVQGNFIGTDAAGAAARGNTGFTTGFGVLITNAPNNTVGGITPGARNLISANGTGVK